MLTTQTRYRGQYNESPFVFNHHNLTSLKISFNGNSYPTPPLEPVYTSNNEIDYARAYFSLMNDSFKVDQAPLVTYDTFKSIFCIYVVNLGAESTLQGDHVNPQQLVNARLDLTFAPSPDNVALTCLVYTECPQMLEINSSRSVLKDYII